MNAQKPIHNKMKMNKPKLRGHFHQAMFFIFLGACSVLIYQSFSPPEIRASMNIDVTKSVLATIIYCIGALLMFGISALYHRINWSASQRAQMRKLDHTAIFLMIAGSFTPIAYFGLSSESSVKLVSLIWLVSLVGILKIFLFPNLPKLLNALIYIVAGYLIIPYIAELNHYLGTVRIALIAFGGLLYSIGGLSYGLKKPNLIPNVFGYHELFHLLVSLGAIVHFVVVYSLFS